MKKHALIGLFSIAMLFFVVSCGQQQDADDTAMKDDPTYDNRMSDENNFWTSNRDYTYDERDEFRRDVNSAIDKLDAEVDRLENEAEDATGETKQWYNERIAELKESRNDLNNEMNDFENTTEETWEDFKSSVSSTWDDIENSWDELVQGERTDTDANY